MRVNYINQQQHNEVIVVNRKNTFQSNNNIKLKKDPKFLGVNMYAKVGYKGKKPYTPAPDSVGERLVKFLHLIQVDWATHIDPNKPVKKF